MRSFPQFLKTLPEFYGLSVHDLAVVLFILYYSMLIDMHPISKLIFLIFGVMASQYIRKRFDLIGFICPKKRLLNLYTSKGDKHESPF